MEELFPRRPTTIRANAFFYYDRNRDFLMGNATTLHVANPMRGREAYWFYLTLSLLAVAVGLLAPDLMLVVGIVLVAIGGLTPYFVGQGLNYSLTTEFKREGDIVEGRLVSFTAARNGRPFSIEALYDFYPTPHQRIRGTVREFRTDLAGQTDPTPGMPVYVLYFPNKAHYLL